MFGNNPIIVFECFIVEKASGKSTLFFSHPPAAIKIKIPITNSFLFSRINAEERNNIRINKPGRLALVKPVFAILVFIKSENSLSAERSIS